MIPLILIFSSILILTDSLYFGELTLTKLWELTMDWEDWKVAPFNFIMYNLVPGNVASHGEDLIIFSEFNCKVTRSTSPLHSPSGEPSSLAGTTGPDTRHHSPQLVLRLLLSPLETQARCESQTISL